MNIAIIYNKVIHSHDKLYFIIKIKHWRLWVAVKYGWEYQKTRVSCLTSQSWGVEDITYIGTKVCFSKLFGKQFPIREYVSFSWIWSNYSYLRDGMVPSVAGDEWALNGEITKYVGNKWLISWDLWTQPE